MDGRGRAFDNIFVERLWRSVKYENVYLNGYATMGELMVGLADYFAFYNSKRPHQSLGDKTPDVVYQTGIGGGALIVDKFPAAVEELPCSATLHRGFLHRKSKFGSNSKSKCRGKGNSNNQSTSNTGAAPSSCK